MKISELKPAVIEIIDDYYNKRYMDEIEEYIRGYKHLYNIEDDLQYYINIVLQKKHGVKVNSFLESKKISDISYIFKKIDELEKILLT